MSDAEAGRKDDDRDEEGFPSLTSAMALPGDWSSRAVYSLGFLTLISSFNYLDRALLGLALPAIKAEMHVSDATLGLVSGLVFVLFYSLLGIPIAWAADRWNRRNIIAVGFAFWSVMTALTGWAANIGQLALARFLMGAGEGCVLAPSNSVISDLFREERRPLALSIFATASAISSILFFPILGWVEQHYGWRTMFIAAGVPGTALALLFVATVREPVRGRTEAHRSIAEAAKIGETVRFLLHSRAYLALVAAATFMGLNVFAASVWSPTFLARVHGMGMAEIAATIGPLRGGFGVAGVVLGGLAVDRLARRARHWRVTLPALACLLAAPAELLFLLGDSPVLWMVGFAASAFLTLVHQGPLFALVMSIARVRMRAVAMAILLLSTSFLGLAVGPYVVGALNDMLAPSLGVMAIRYSLLVIVASALAGGGMLLLAGRYIEADVARADALSVKE